MLLLHGAPIMEASVRELKAHLSEYLRQVAAGQEIVVTSHGKPVARLTTPLPVVQTPEEIEAEAIARLQSLPWIRPGDGKKVQGSDRPLPPGGEGTSSEEIMRWLRG